MAEAMPSTPQIKQAANPLPNRRLWTSPAFSDYFSGDDASTWSLSPETSVLKSAATPFSDGLRAPSPDSYGGRTLQNSFHDSQLSQTSRSQRHLLQRLNSIGRSIVTSDLDDDQCVKLGVDVDRMESTISAPESQSREPAEDEMTGLFNDDVTESSTIVQGPSSGRHETHELVLRVTKAAAELQQRLLEIKHTNDLATAKLEAAAREITILRKKNEDLENSDSQSEILYLRLRLNSLEERAKSHLGRRGQEDLVNNIERLNLASTPQSKSRQRNSIYSIRSTAHSDDVFIDDSRPGDGLGFHVMRNRKSKGIANGVIYTNGQITPITENVMNDDSLDIIDTKDDGLDLDSVPNEALSVEDSDVRQSDDGLEANSDDAGIVPDLSEPLPLALDNVEEENINDVVGSVDGSQALQLDKDDQPAVPISTPQDRLQKARKSPWQMLWDDLAEFSGIRNDEDEDDDEYDDKD